MKYAILQTEVAVAFKLCRLAGLMLVEGPFGLADLFMLSESKCCLRRRNVGVSCMYGIPEEADVRGGLNRHTPLRGLVRVMLQ